MISLIAAELVKIRKRRATWIIFGVLVAIMAFFFIPLRLIIRASEGVGPDQPPPGSFDLMNQSLGFPQGYGALSTLGGQTGPWLLIVLVALLIGSEYGWGTLRLVLARGPSRTEFLLAKLLAMAITVVFGTLALLVVGAIIMPLGDLAVGAFAPTLPDGFISALALDWLRATSVMLIYVAIAFAAAGLTRSGGAGLGIGLLFLFLESILTPIFSSLGGFWGDATRFFPANLVRAVQSANELSAGEFASGSLVEVVDPWVGGLVLIAYFIVLMGATIWVFNRRDITGAAV